MDANLYTLDGQIRTLKNIESFHYTKDQNLILLAKNGVKTTIQEKKLKAVYFEQVS